MAAVSITAASIVPVAGFSSETNYLSGGTITRGQAVYLTATNVWALADANLSAVAAGSLGIGISLSDVATGQSMIVFIGGNLGMGVCLTVGKVYCVNNVAGEIIAHAELVTLDRVTILGVATTTSNLNCSKMWYTGATIP